jgi:predicted nucleic acid-binding protein
MIVVSNATPLIFLGKLNAVHLIEALYSRVLISPRVYHETIHNGLQYGHTDALVLDLYYQRHILTMQPLANQAAATQLAQNEGLDLGEAETLMLAHEQQADLTLIDEQRARKVARNKALPVKGTLGVLFEACQKGITDVSQTTMYIQQIIRRKDIWISLSLCQDVLNKIRP